MEIRFYSEEAVAELYDDVLIRCIVEFRQALGMLERNGLAPLNPYTAEMRRALGVMEAEVARRRHAALAEQQPARPPASVPAQAASRPVASV